MRLNKTKYQLADELAIAQQRIAELEALSLAKSESLSWKESILNSSSIGILVVTNNRIITEVNNKLAEMFGYSKEEMLGNSVHMIHLDEQRGVQFGEKFWAKTAETKTVTCEYPLKKKDGTTVLCELSGTAINSNALWQGVVWAVVDISERKKIEHDLLFCANHDHLTGIYNRGFFVRQLEEEVWRSKRYKRHISLIMIDVDDFKKVNDLYGHIVGDSVLKWLCAEVQLTLRQADIFGRVGGEEFGIALPETEIAGAVQLAERIRESIFTQTFAPDSIELQLTLSFGVAMLAQDDDCDSFFKRSDDALIIAKSTGKNKVVVL
ncbi:sensor domain-containing diguanylate cyclase [Desulfovibrio sp. TomC]|uniref:sensor domain-containing diguanylate cyclase n=1 Tax=Desulfovibrio sp. TomC TaxID=1562888 RepID=UPI0009E50A98|nr:sensor domain-containing diguanylate cyclase [Desulfovibrio sp. TomC]